MPAHTALRTVLSGPYDTLGDMHITGPKTLRSKREDKEMMRRAKSELFGDMTNSLDLIPIPSDLHGEK